LSILPYTHEFCSIPHQGELLDAEIIRKVSEVIFNEENVKSEEKTELEKGLEQNEKGIPTTASWK
jgi:hypothetical protein